MPKYQIILEHPRQFADDELEIRIDHDGSLKIYPTGFRLVYAQNLEGIRKELWEKKERILDSNGTETREEWNTEVNETFSQIEKMFNLE